MPCRNPKKPLRIGEDVEWTINNQNRYGTVIGFGGAESFMPAGFVEIRTPDGKARNVRADILKRMTAPRKRQLRHTAAAQEKKSGDRKKPVAGGFGMMRTSLSGPPPALTLKYPTEKLRKARGGDAPLFGEDMGTYVNPGDDEAGRLARMGARSKADALKAHIRWVQEVQLGRKLASSELAILKQRFNQGWRQAYNPHEDAIEAAAKLSANFHGRPAEEITIHVEEEAERSVLSQLGRIISLEIVTDDGEAYEIPFRNGKAGVTLSSSPDGKNLYFVGGDQTFNPADLDIQSDKDQLPLGDCTAITYHTTKAFHDFEPTDYRHAFGEETGKVPTLGYSQLNSRFYLEGGDYLVKPEGIIN